jgi:hypothetical protein
MALLVYVEIRVGNGRLNNVHVDLGVQSCTIRLLCVTADATYLHFLMSYCPQTWENMYVRTTVFIHRYTVLNFRA